MSEVPAGWQSAPLGEICRVYSGATPKTGVPEYWGGDIPWITPLDMSGNVGQYMDGGARFITKAGLNSCSAKVIPAGSVVYSSRAPIGYVAIATADVATNQGCKSATPPEFIDTKYLYYYLIWRTPEIRTRASGTTFLEISGKRFAETLLLWPTLDEQRRIVAILEDHLSRLDAAEVSLKGALLRADGLETALLSSAFLGRVIGEGMESSEIKAIADARRESWERAFSTKAPKPPLSIQDEQETHTRVDWPLASLDAVTDPVRTIRYGILMPRVRDGGEVPYVEVKDLLGDTLEGKVLHRTSRAMDEQFSGARIRTGDLLHAVRGSYDRSAVVPIGMDGTNISRDVVRIVPLPGISPHFLHYWMRSPQCKAYMTRHARGVAVKGVNIESLRQLPVPLASTAAQEQVVEQLSKEMAHLSQMRASARRSIERASGLRRALLAAAFSGQLTKESSVV